MRHFLLRLLLLRDAVKCSALNLKLCVVLTQNLVRIWASGCDAVWTTNDGPSVCLFVLTSQQEVIIPREFWELLLSEVRILDPRQCVPDIYETCVPSKCRERLSSDMASFIHSFFFVCLTTGIWQFHIKFSTQCHVMFPLSIYSTLSFPWGHSVPYYDFFLVFPSPISPVIPSISQKNGMLKYAAVQSGNLLA